MNKKIKLMTICAIALLCSISCQKDPTPDTSGYTNHEQIREDVKVFAEMVIYQQALTLRFMGIVSDEFTKTLFSATPEYDDMDSHYAMLAKMVDKIPDFEKSVEKLENSGVLNQIVTRGIIDSFYNWCSSLIGVGKNNRERILKIASNMSSEERSELYNDVLRTNWKNQAKNEQDFWNKLEKGDYDNASSQIINDFTHNNTSFAILAQEKGLTTHKIFVAEGSNIVEKGASFYVDAAGTISGLGDGITLVSIANDSAELAFTDKSLTEKAQLAKNILLNITGLDGMDPLIKMVEQNSSFPEKVAEICQNIQEYEKTKIDPQPSNLAENGQGKINVEDLSGSSSKADIVIGQKQGASSGNAPSIMILVGSVVESGKTILTGLFEQGEWLISAINKQGQIETQKVTVAVGEEVEIWVITEEADNTSGSNNGNNNNDKDDDWKELAKEYSILSKFPAPGIKSYRQKALSGSMGPSEWSGVQLWFKEGIVTQTFVQGYIKKLQEKGFTVERRPEIEENDANCIACYEGFIIDDSGVIIDKLSCLIMFNKGESYFNYARYYIDTEYYGSK